MGFFTDALAGVINSSLSNAQQAARQGKETQEVRDWRDRHEKFEKQIEDTYQLWLKKRQSEFNEDYIVDSIKNAAEKSAKDKWGVGLIGYDYSPFDSLPADVRESKIMKDYINSRLEAVYKGAAEGYLDKNADLDLGALMRSLQPLAYFEEIREIVEHSIKHISYFDYSKNIRSVLTGCEDVEAELNRIYRMPVSEDDTQFTTEYFEEVEYYLADKKYHEAYDRLTGANYDESVFEGAKRGILRAAINTTFDVADSSALDAFDDIRKFVGTILRVSVLGKNAKNENVTYVTTVPDVIIADAIVYQRSGSIDKIDEELNIFLDVGKGHIEQDQYEVLRRVFAYLKAYKQECEILESMVAHGVARTEQQERRLVFLRNNMNSLQRSEDILEREILYEKNDDQLVYDYRCVTWSDDQVKTYFDRLSVEDKPARNILVAVDWFKNLNIQSDFVWNIEQVNERISACLQDNFGDYIVSKLVDASSLSGEYLEFDKVLYVSEQEHSNDRNPWLAFIVSAEQMTKRQISVSVYALYIPERDYCSLTDVIERNKHLCARFLSIKNKQNPKINNYIYTMQSVLIDELEKYINTEIKTESIY